MSLTPLQTKLEHISNWEPVEVLEERSDVITGSGVGVVYIMLLSIVTPRLRLWGYGDRVELSMERRKVEMVQRGYLSRNMT